jgi:hypothetical protein
MRVKGMCFLILALFLADVRSEITDSHRDSRILAQAPFNGTPFQLPGRIEAEDYDKGGEGVAYHDLDPENQGGAYRSEGVDIESCGEGGYNIGWVGAEEWQEYAVNVTIPGFYDIDVRTAAYSQGGFFHIQMGSTNITGTQQAPGTGDWQVYTTVTIPDVTLTAGQKVLRFVCESDGFNVNYIEFRKVTDTLKPSVSIVTPLNGQVFPEGQDISITASASDPDGHVVRVEFFSNGALLAEDTSAPFTAVLENAGPGVMDLEARATDNEGASRMSGRIRITVVRDPLLVRLEKPDFSPDRGFYGSALDLSVTSGIDSLPVVTLKYTLDGSDPRTSATALQSKTPMSVRVDPQSAAGRPLTPCVIVRAVSMYKGYGSSDVKTSTYLFLDRIKTQTYPGGAWPSSSVKGQAIDYSMDSRVVDDNRYKNLIDDALLDIPTLSISTDLGNLFNPDSGIYVNAQFHGEKWERACSVELIHPNGTDGFQIDAGLRIRGGWSRHNDCPKHAFRLFFRGRYGKGKLVYPLFGKEGANEFDKMDLRTAMNYSWSFYGDPLNIMNRDVFSRDAQGEMGQPYTRSRYYHLYLDGMYWGLYQTQERSEARYAETYFGGSYEDYDVVKMDIGDWWNLYTIEATDGNLEAWEDIWDLCRQGFSSNSNYFRIQGLGSDGKRNPSLPVLVDIDNLIDYMLVIFLTGNFDAPVTKFGQNKGPNNFFAIYNRNGLSGFKFFAQDNEHTLLTEERSPGVGMQENRVNIGSLTDSYRMTVDDFSKFHPQWLHFRLSSNAEYRMRFADRTYRHLFNRGALTPEANIRRFSKRAEEIRLAIIGESARWGDSRSGSPRTRDDDWVPQIQNVIKNYFPFRNDIVIGQLIDEELFTDIKPVKFMNGNSEIRETAMAVQSGYTINLVRENAAGSIQYTTDGTDPRAIGGAISPAATNGAGQAVFTVTRTTWLKARIRSGSDWSPLHEILFSVAGESDALRITEIHYHPLDLDTLDDGLFEFLEIKNTGSAPVDLSRMSFTNGISYTFPEGSVLSPGGFWVLASDPERFSLRYGIHASGMYAGRLDNSGERLTLLDAAQDTVMTFRYGDEAPWPQEADGGGYSLVPVNPDSPDDPANPLLWRRSWETHGSPGRDDVKVGLESGAGPIPVRTELYDGYPNPFNAAAAFRFDLANPGPVTVQIFDMRGREIALLGKGIFTAGSHELQWVAGGSTAGIYICRMQAGPLVRSRKILLLK